MKYGPRQSAWNNPAGGTVRRFRSWLPGGLIAWWVVGWLALDAGRPVGAEPPVAPPDPAAWSARDVSVDDVALRAEGILLGRVVTAGEGGLRRGVAGVGIVLRRQSRVVAQTATDAEGRFAISHLSGGVYELAARTPQGVYNRCCRLWAGSAAPPSAMAEIELVDDGQHGQLVRGQSPFPVASIGRVATIAGIAAGAIAVPAIYNTKKTEWIPASP